MSYVWPLINDIFNLRTHCLLLINGQNKTLQVYTFHDCNGFCGEWLFVSTLYIKINDEAQAQQISQRHFSSNVGLEALSLNISAWPQ